MLRLREAIGTTVIGTPGARILAKMSRRWLVGFALVLAACTLDNTRDAYAPDAVFHEEISACVDRSACEQLCIKLFQVDVGEIAACRITSRDAGGANVRVTVYGEDAFGSDDSDWGDDGWGDDSDDGYGDDGSDDTGSDTGDDGSGSGSDDSGSGSGSDGSDDTMDF
jgi:hypothetical protein